MKSVHRHPIRIHPIRAAVVNGLIGSRAQFVQVSIQITILFVGRIGLATTELIEISLREADLLVDITGERSRRLGSTVITLEKLGESFRPLQTVGY